MIFTTRTYLRELVGVSLGFCLVFLPGCSGYDETELAFLTKEDAGFLRLVESKGQADRQIAQLKDELLTRKSEIDQKTKAMKQAFRQEMETKNSRIGSLKEKLGTARESYSLETEKLGERLKLRKKESDEVGGAIRNVREVLEDKETVGIAGEELQQWQNRLQELERRLGSLESEIKNIGSEISLRRKKIKYL